MSLRCILGAFSNSLANCLLLLAFELFLNGGWTLKRAQELVELPLLLDPPESLKLLSSDQSLASCPCLLIILVRLVLFLVGGSADDHLWWVPVLSGELGLLHTKLGPRCESILNAGG